MMVPQVQQLQAAMANGQHVDRCPPCPPGLTPRFWRQVWSDIRRGLTDLAGGFKLAAVGGCGGACGGGCGVCAAPPSRPQGNDHVASAYAGNVPADYAIPDAARWDPVVARRCLSPITSALTPVPANATAPTVVPIDIPISPSQGCFVGMWRKVTFKDSATLADIPGLVGRSFVGDCPVSCRNQFMLNDFLQSDDCLGCPIPTVEIGMPAMNQQLHNEVSNLFNAEALVQITVWGVCYPSNGCLRFCAPRPMPSA